MKPILYPLLLLAITLASQSCNLGKDKEDKDKDDTKPTACNELTKDGDAACTKADAIQGKVCIWEFDECIEQNDNIKNFRAQDMKFKANLRAGAANLATDEVLGTDHGERPNWDTLCEIKPAADRALETVVESITLNFKKDKKEVDLVLDCTRGGGAKKTYTFTYDAKATSGDALLIRLANKGAPVTGQFETINTTGNLLDFFSKADWLYSAKKSALYGISQLKKLGYTYETTKLDSEGDFDKAFTYARSAAGNGYKVGEKDGTAVGAITIKLTKI